MSILGMIGGTLLRNTVRVATKKLSGGGRSSVPAVIQPTGFLPDAVSNFLPDIGVSGPGVFSQDKPPSGYHLSKQAPFHFVKNRRMNYANGRAAMRAVRRVKGTMKLLKKIEKLLPKRPAPNRRSTGARHLTGPRHSE